MHLAQNLTRLLILSCLAFAVGCQPYPGGAESREIRSSSDGSSAGPDHESDEAFDAGLDADAGTCADAGLGTHADAGTCADAGLGTHADAGLDAGPDAGLDAEVDAGLGGNPDVGPIDLPIDSATISRLVLLRENLSLRSTAVGRTQLDGTVPTIELDDSGYTHPSVIHVPEGWNGFAYWMATSPYYGPIGHDDQYENPHLFRSTDGLRWEEPPGIQNPIDRSPDAPSPSYWSDPHLVLAPAGVLYCFYRGAGIELGGRSLVYRTSLDGVLWSDRHFTYASGTLASVDYTNKLLSPVVIANGDGWDVFDAVRSSPTALTLPATKNQTATFVMRRSSSEIARGYGEYDAGQIVAFSNRPWGLAEDPWHLDVRFLEGRWFMLLNTGPIGASGAQALWLAVSGDGWTFHVVENPLFRTGTYRSALVPLAGDRNSAEFRVYRSDMSDGSLDVYELRVTF